MGQAIALVILRTPWVNRTLLPSMANLCWGIVPWKTFKGVLL